MNKIDLTNKFVRFSNHKPSRRTYHDSVTVSLAQTKLESSEFNSKQNESKIINNLKGLLRVNKLAYKRLGLSVGKKKTGGRNNQGRITSFHRGGGNKLRYIYINKSTGPDNLSFLKVKSGCPNSKNFSYLDTTSFRFLVNVGKDLNRNTVNNVLLDTSESSYQNLIQGKLKKPKYSSGEVRYIVRDPNRTTLIAGVYWSDVKMLVPVPNALGFTASVPNSENYLKDLVYNRWYSYFTNILAPEGLNLGSVISNNVKRVSIKGSESESVLGPSVRSLGCKVCLKDLMVGTIVHNIEGKYIRSAGCSGIVISKIGSVQKSLGQNPDTMDPVNYSVTVKLQSGQSKVFPGETSASIGVLSNGEHKSRDYRKAGQKRWLGRRPIVRGVAMNPIDHPHGGGEGKSSGGRPSVTPWGKPTKGKPTRSPKKPSRV